MGFGKSETPADREYTLSTHVANLTTLIESLDLREITLVMQDWGGPIGVGFAVRHAARIHSLVFMNTVCGYGAVWAAGSAEPNRIAMVSLDPRWPSHGPDRGGDYFRILAPLFCP